MNSGSDLLTRSSPLDLCRTFFGGHSLGSKDFELWGAIKGSSPAVSLFKRKIALD